MAIIKDVYQTNFSGPLFGTFTTTLSGTAQNVPFGLTPSSIEAWNLTQATTPTNTKISWFFWEDSMPNASAFIRLYNATPSDVTSYITTNGVTPYQTSDATKWVPNLSAMLATGSTNLTVTNISNAAQAVVTAANNFTSADENVTWGTFHNVVGMDQINTIRGQVIHATDSGHFTINVDTTNMGTYSSGGNYNVITGAPVTTQFGPQVIMSPQRDLGVAGLTLGLTLMQNTNDIWYFRTMWNGPVEG